MFVLPQNYDLLAMLLPPTWREKQLRKEINEKM